MKKNSISVNAVCFILAGVLIVLSPLLFSNHVSAGTVSREKRADSVLQSTGNVMYRSSDENNSKVFDVTDLYYVENRINDELASVCE